MSTLPRLTPCRTVHAFPGTKVGTAVLTLEDSDIARNQSVSCLRADGKVRRLGAESLVRLLPEEVEDWMPPAIDAAQRGWRAETPAEREQGLRDSIDRMTGEAEVRRDAQDVRDADLPTSAWHADCADPRLCASRECAVYDKICQDALAAMALRQDAAVVAWECLEHSAHARFAAERQCDDATPLVRP